jgi:RNA-directed DNA polymerase
MDTSSAELIRLSRSAHRLYRVETRSIDGKERTLAIPTPSLAKLQRRLARSLPKHFGVGPYSFCERGRGIRLAADKHRGHKYLLHIDIKSFFPSVAPTDVKGALEALRVAPVIAGAIADICTHNDQLSQGAPSSVALGNAVLRRLDNRIGGLARKHGISFTRYVDDLALSGGRVVEKLRDRFAKIIVDEGWTISSKSSLSGPGDSHRYLGLVLNREINVDSRFIADLRYVISLAERGVLLLTDRQRQQVLGRAHYLRWIKPVAGERLLARVASLP